MSNKEIYTEWAKKQTHLPIFMQPWWMDAVCAGKEWDVLLIEKLKIKNYELTDANSQMSDVRSQMSERSVQVDDSATIVSAPDEHPMSIQSASDEHPMKTAEKEEENNGVSANGEGNDGEKEIVAAMPYLFRKKWWMKWIIMTPHAHSPVKGNSVNMTS